MNRKDLILIVSSQKLVTLKLLITYYFSERLHLHGQPSTLKPEMGHFLKMLMLHIEDYMMLHPEDSNLNIHRHENLISEICSCSFYSPAFCYFFLGLNSLSILFLNTLITCEI